MAVVPADDARPHRARPHSHAAVGIKLHQAAGNHQVIKDIPAGKCIYWFERTDLSPSMMAIGTPTDVDGAVKHLLDKVWNKGGNLILDTAFGIRNETPVENVRAMYAAARVNMGAESGAKLE
jgi:hypothetical protein